jgi:hypothetical protein
MIGSVSGAWTGTTFITQTLCCARAAANLNFQMKIIATFFIKSFKLITQVKSAGRIYVRALTTSPRVLFKQETETFKKKLKLFS